jgi:hypothetical protein
MTISSRTKFSALVLIAILALTYLAWESKFIQDDAFISFRYADNLVQGHGLVWNPGEQIEGYTNFLWTIIIAVGVYANIDPIVFSFALGMVCFAFTLFFTYKLAFLILKSEWLALLTIGLLGTNYTFASYATGGLETQLQAGLFVSTVYLLLSTIKERSWMVGRAIFISILLTIGLLTRLDSGLLVIIVLPVALHTILRQKIARRMKIRELLGLLMPVIIIVGGWFIWKLGYYGDILPNSFYAKSDAFGGIIRGIRYVYAFFYSYWLLPFVALIILSIKRLVKPEFSDMRIPITLTILWIIYIIAVGGDFMEFRFFVPIMPFIFILITWIICISINVRSIHKAVILLLRIFQISFVLLITTNSWYYSWKQAPMWSESVLAKYDIEAIPQLQNHLYARNEDWVGIGKLLGEAFNYSPDVTIAMTAAGAIPYYSGLKSIDMLGINDKWVTRHGELVGTRPGHQRRATLKYLLDKKIDIIISHPVVLPTSLRMKKLPLQKYYGINDIENVPPELCVLGIPLNSDYKLIVIYLEGNPVVDDAIARNGWDLHRQKKNRS